MANSRLWIISLIIVGTLLLGFGIIGLSFNYVSDLQAKDITNSSNPPNSLGEEIITSPPEPSAVDDSTSTLQPTPKDMVAYPSDTPLTNYALMPTRSDNPTPGNTLYVSVTGNDMNTGTIESPWRNIDHSIQLAEPGDTIIIRSGQYYGMLEIMNKNGEENKPITIRPYPGEEVVIRSDDWAGIYINGSSWIKIYGLYFTGASFDGVFITNSNYITIENCISFNNGGVGIHISSAWGSANNNTIQNCDVHNNKEEGIYLDVKSANPVPVENNVITNNRIYDNGYEGIQNTQQNGLTPKPNGTKILNNQVENNGADWATFDLGGDNLTIEGNFITNNYAPGGGIYYSGGSGTLIANNIIYNNFLDFKPGDGIIINNVSDTKVENNTVYSSLGASKTGVVILGTNINNTIINNKKIE